MVLWALLLREIAKFETRHSYRFIIIPETIGAIAYLAANEREMQKVAGGFVLTSVAGPGEFGYKRTFMENSIVDRVAKKTFKELNIAYVDYPFDINGSDESHYSAPYFRIPVGTICKDKYYEYDYYHTSLDNLEFISPENLVETLKLYVLSIQKIEYDITYKSNNPYCEAMLGKRNLYPKIGGHIKQRAANMTTAHNERGYTITEDKILYGSELDAIGWIMFYSDGGNSLLDIAEKTSLPLQQLFRVAKKLEAHGLLSEICSPGGE